MNVKWLIELETFRENEKALKSILQRKGMEFKTIAYTPAMSDDVPYLFKATDCVVVYSSLQLLKHVQRECQWIPGAYGNLAHMECTYYYPRLGQFLLNNRYTMLPYGEMLRQKDFLIQTHGVRNCLFVRPSSGFKLFAGQVISGDTYERDVEQLGFYDVEPEKIVCVSEPRNIALEWRLVVVNGKVVTGSQYKEYDALECKPGMPDEVLRYGNEIAKVWQPDTCWTLDVCQLANGELKLLEIGSFSGAGLYDCDLEIVVDKVSEAALKEWEDVYKV